MASKGKGKLKRTEIYCKEKLVDLKRFAYDVIVYSAIRFQIPVCCICKWDGPKNDYGHPDFLKVICRLIFKNQIGMRKFLHGYFEDAYEANKLQSFKDVSDLFQEVLKRSTTGPEGGVKLEFTTELEITISDACELILFLYSKNSNLYLKELANYWFECYMAIRKDKFVKVGGLDALYAKGSIPAFVDAVYKDFIPRYCLPYDASVKLEQLDALFVKHATEHKNENESPTSRKPRRIQVTIHHYSSGVGYVTESGLESLPVSVPERQETSSIDELQNIGLGIRPHEELLRDIDASVADSTTSQDIPKISPQELARRRPSGHDKRQKLRTRLYSDVESGLEQSTLESSGTSRMKKPSESVSDDESPSQNTGLGIRPHEELLRDIAASDADKTTPQDIPEISPQELARRRRRSSGHEKRQKVRSRLYSDVEPGLGQSTLESSGTSRMKKPNESVSEEESSSQNTGLGIRPHEELLRDVDTTPPHATPGISPQELARRRRSSGHEKRQKPRTKLYSYMEQGLGQTTSDSSGTSSMKTLSESVSDDPSPSRKLLGARPKEQAKHRRGLSGQQRRQEAKSGSCSGVEQGLAQLSLEPTKEKRPSKKKDRV